MVISFFFVLRFLGFLCCLLVSFSYYFFPLPLVI